MIMMGTLIGVKGVDPSPYACQRLQRMRALIASAGLQDRHNTVPRLRRAGADVVIAGSLVYKSTDLAETFAWLHGLPAAKNQPAANSGS